MKKRKKIIVAAAISALVIGISCITVSYLGSTDSLDNKFRIGHNKSSVDEEFEPKIQQTGVNIYKKTVAVKNENNVPCYARLYVDFTDSVSAEKSYFSNDKYTDDNGTGCDFYSAVRNVSEDTFVKHLNDNDSEGAKWVFVPDNQTGADAVLAGYYYYTGVLEPGESTESLFKQVKVVNRDSNDDINAFNVLVYSETVQAKGYTNYKAAWTEFLKQPS